MNYLPPNADILPASDDRVFKLMMTSPEAKPVLIDLITALIHRPVADVSIRNNELPPGDTDEKAVRLDVNCVIEDGTQIDLEMQASHIKEDTGGEYRNLIGKSIYYLCDLHASQASKGKPYKDLVQTYQVTICGYTVFAERRDYVNSFSMRHDTDNGLLSDTIHVIYVELSKLDDIIQKPVHDMTDMEKWAVFFEYAHVPQRREAVNKVIETKEVLQMASELLTSISQDERERAMYRSRRMYLSDLENNMIMAKREGLREGMEKGKREGLLEGMEKGKREGLQEGLREGLREAARAMKKSSVISNEMIAQMTGLSVPDVEQL